MTETYQALDDAGTDYTIRAFTEAVQKRMPDGSTERTEGAKTHKTEAGHPILVHEDGMLEDRHDRIRVTLNLRALATLP